MIISCVFKRLQEEEESSSQEELRLMNTTPDDNEEIWDDPVLKLGKTYTYIFSHKKFWTVEITV